MTDIDPTGPPEGPEVPVPEDIEKPLAPPPTPLDESTPAESPSAPASSIYTVPAPYELPSPTTAPPRAGVSVGGAIAIAVAAALFIGALAGGAAGFLGSQLYRESGSSSTIRVVPSETDEPAVAAAAAALPSVVNVDVSSGATPTADGSLPEGHPGVPQAGNGSGVALRTENGTTYIITNAHVVEEADQIVVTGQDRNRHRAELIGADADTDIAVIAISGRLPGIELGDSDDLEVGQMVVAIGSPFGLAQSVSSGVISAIGRSLPDSLSSQEGVYPLVDVIQTDAAINPGNSGGALVDRIGRLIGVNTAIYSDTGASGGVGFAVPVNTAVRIADELIADGKVEHPYLGILGRSLDPALVAAEDLPVDEGAYIVDVQKGTQAAAAGITTGDVIVSLDDDEIRSMDDLILQVRRRNVGDVVIVSLYRDGERIQIEMEVGIKPETLDFESETATPPVE